jgi:hypothetical protein
MDSERSAPNAPLGAGHQRLIDACKSLSIPCTVLDRRSVESYFPDHAVKSVYGPVGRALLPYERTKDADFGWSKAKNFRVAAASSPADLAGTDLGELLAGL